MPPTAPPATAAPPDDPVRAALDDPRTGVELHRHAWARLRSWLAGRPTETRQDLADEAVQETVRRALSPIARHDGDNLSILIH